jgi:hypothetical protein
VATPHPDRTNVLDQQQMAAMRQLTEPAAEPIERAQNPIILHKSVVFFETYLFNDPMMRTFPPFLFLDRYLS